VTHTSIFYAYQEQMVDIDTVMINCFDTVINKLGALFTMYNVVMFKACENIIIC